MIIKSSLQIREFYNLFLEIVHIYLIVYVHIYLNVYNRCHKDFWSRVHTDLGVVMLVPEYKTYMVMEGQKITEQQKEVLKELDYECEVYCEQLPSKDESVQECFENVFGLFGADFVFDM